MFRSNIRRALLATLTIVGFAVVPQSAAHAGNVTLFGSAVDGRVATKLEKRFGKPLQARLQRIFPRAIPSKAVAKRLAQMGDRIQKRIMPRVQRWADNARRKRRNMTTAGNRAAQKLARVIEKPLAKRAQSLSKRAARLAVERIAKAAGVSAAQLQFLRAPLERHALAAANSVKERVKAQVLTAVKRAFSTAAASGSTPPPPAGGAGGSTPAEPPASPYARCLYNSIEPPKHVAGWKEIPTHSRKSAKTGSLTDPTAFVELEAFKQGTTMRIPFAMQSKLRMPKVSVPIAKSLPGGGRSHAISANAYALLHKMRKDKVPLGGLRQFRFGNVVNMQAVLIVTKAKRDNPRISGRALGQLLAAKLGGSFGAGAIVQSGHDLLSVEVLRGSDQDAKKIVSFFRTIPGYERLAQRMLDRQRRKDKRPYAKLFAGFDVVVSVRARSDAARDRKACVSTGGYKFDGKLLSVSIPKPSYYRGIKPKPKATWVAGKGTITLKPKGGYTTTMECTMAVLRKTKRGGGYTNQPITIVPIKLKEHPGDVCNKQRVPELGGYLGFSQFNYMKQVTLEWITDNKRSTRTNIVYKEHKLTAQLRGVPKLKIEGIEIKAHEWMTTELRLYVDKCLQFSPSTRYFKGSVGKLGLSSMKFSVGSSSLTVIGSGVRWNINPSDCRSWSYVGSERAKLRARRGN